jgi:hypothetical protein
MMKKNAKIMSAPSLLRLLLQKDIVKRAVMTFRLRERTQGRAGLLREYPATFRLGGKTQSNFLLEKMR